MNKYSVTIIDSKLSSSDLTAVISAESAELAAVKYAEDSWELVKRPKYMKVMVVSVTSYAPQLFDLKFVARAEIIPERRVHRGPTVV